MDEDDLDRHLQAAKEESLLLAALEERALKKQRLSDVERANQERRQRMSLQPRVPARPVTHKGTAAQHHRQLQAGPDVNNGGAVNIADLRWNAELGRSAGALLGNLNLVTDSDTEPEYGVSDQHRQCLITNASQPAMGRGVSPGARMQPVVADLQEGQGDPSKVRGPGGFSLLL